MEFEVDDSCHVEFENRLYGGPDLPVFEVTVIWLLNQYYDNENHYPQVGEFTQMEIGLTDLHRPYVDEIL